VDAPAVLEVDRGRWEARVAAYTAPFADHGYVLEASSRLVASRVVRWFVSSEGSRIQDTRLAYRLVVSALTKANDGMELPRYESWFAYSEDGLPSDEEVQATVAQMISDLAALRAAPVVDPYTGPAILSGRASGVFFHEIFGHRVEGHRLASEEDAQTFKKMVGQEILPTNFSVVFDPTRRTLGETELSGFYRYDNQGVAARPVTVVDHGVLRNFLMARKPAEGFPSSNGHGRKAPGYAPVARQSNLLVQVDDPVSHSELKERLLERVRAEDKPYGLVFEDIQGGFTFTGRGTPNAFNVIPVMVYRVFPDGREELVRGVDLIGTPLTAFSKLVTGDDQPGVFNGTCGAESGGVPVSAASPAVLVSQIEVQKKEKSQERPPLLPAPTVPEDAE
jgi:predicted Zn-dependent protease